MAKICLMFAALFLIVQCSPSYLGKIGEQKYPNAEQAISEQISLLKDKFQDNTSLFVYASENDPRNAEIAEITAIKLVEAASPKVNVLERKNLDKALEELETQSSDLYDQETTVSLGKMIGAQFMLVAETSPQKNIFVKLYHEEMQKELIYEKIDLKIKLIELETGKITIAQKNYYWDIAPNQNVEEKYRRIRYRPNSILRYVNTQPSIFIVPNRQVVYRPANINRGNLTEQQKKDRAELRRLLKEKRDRQKKQKLQDRDSQKQNETDSSGNTEKSKKKKKKKKNF